MKSRCYGFILVILLILSQAATAQTQIKIMGSKTMEDVARLWAETYHQKNPVVDIIVKGSGSGAGIATFINGTAEIVISSRALRQGEIMLLQRRGKYPAEHIVGYDALAIYVHENNPLDTIAIVDLAEIYAEGGKLTKWSELGIEVPGCRDGNIRLAGRHNTSGTYTYFRKTVMGTRCYKWNIESMLKPEDVLEYVMNNFCAIGYGPLTPAASQIKPLCISSRKDQQCVMPNVETSVDDSYPLTRPLYIYTNDNPKAEIKNYLDWILSDEGQCLALKKGYTPVRPLSCQ
jgi:phosphate transport system substrate-binding protein